MDDLEKYRREKIDRIQEMLKEHQDDEKSVKALKEMRLEWLMMDVEELEYLAGIKF